MSVFYCLKKEVFKNCASFFTPPKVADAILELFRGKVKLIKRTPLKLRHLIIKITTKRVSSSFAI